MDLRRPVAILDDGTGLPEMERQLRGRGITVQRRKTSQAWREVARRMDEPILIGSGQSADEIVDDYVQILAHCRPLAVVLHSTQATAEALGYLTCPYFLLHGTDDPRQAGDRHDQDAILHHQMRYGDVTTGLVLPHTGMELTPQGCAEIAWWLSTQVIRRYRKTVRAAEHNSRYFRDLAG